MAGSPNDSRDAAVHDIRDVTRTLSCSDGVPHGTSSPSPRSPPKRLGRVLRSLGIASLDILAPRSCIGCDEAAGGVTHGWSTEPFCRSCAPGAPESWEIDGIPACAAGTYRGPMERAVHALKYGKRADLAGPLGNLLRGPWSQLGSEADALVAVPLHPRRLRERGYNQAALLASRLAAATNTRSRPRALRRIRETRPLPGLNRAERAEQLAGAIVARRALLDARIVLVDDVITSGATIRACRNALNDAGARVIGVVALARAESKGREDRIGREGVTAGRESVD